MEKLNLNEYLFHGIEPWKDILGSKMLMDSIVIFQKILNTGYIASRNLLKETLSEEEYKLLDMSGRMNWNKDDWVSVVPTLHPEIEGIHSILEDFEYLPEDFHGLAYNFYVQEYPAIVLDARLLKELQVNGDSGPRFLGEIQVKEKISSEYFVGVTIPELIQTDAFLNWLLTDDKNIKIGYHPWYEKAQVDVFDLTEEEFVQKYYKAVILFEEVLKETSPRLKLYHSETGQPIVTSTERREQIEKFKKKRR